ncbi:MAG: hypothetical protein K9M49_09030 [Candidatus Marinimicrobia bacterium]|nr:hypothetical protein [Candidatus Neomarinimicrobiota bacterium]MCF7905277.1 hypothetical protein [Candidatus Neomarinimicrobiota bacterium]
MKVLRNIVVLILLVTPLMGQNITVTANPDLADWDVIKFTEMTGSFGPSSPLLFGIRIESDTYPVKDLELHVALTAYSEALQLENTTIFNASVKMDLLAPLTINNKQLSMTMSLDDIPDEAGNTISFNEYDYYLIDAAEQTRLQEGILANGGNMPGGTYTLTRQVRGTNPETGEAYNVQAIGYDEYRTIVITQSAGITLIRPDLGEEIVSNTFPVFEWNSSGCDEYYIKICEYNPLMHSSPEDAINGESSFPYPSTGDFAYVGSATSLDYAAVSGKPLEVGKAYAWQVKKVCQSVSTTNEETSLIYGFTITEAGQTITVCQEQIRSAIGDTQYNILFGRNGPLYGFGECGDVSMDGETMNSSDFSALLVQLINGAYTIESITTQ